MDTIRNLLKPGGNVDDEIMYGSGASSNAAHTGNTGVLSGEGSHLASAQATGSTSGEGSHFSSAKDTVNTGNTANFTGPHSSGLANKADPSVDTNPGGHQAAENTNTGYGSTGGSTMPGGFPDEDQTPNPYSSKAVDPRLGDSIQSTSTVVPEAGNTNTATHGNLTGENTSHSTDHHYARDGAALGGGAAVAEGIHHHRENEPAVGSEAPSTMKHQGPATSTSTKTTTSTTTGPHNSSLLNKLDPRVKNDQTHPTESAKQTGHHYGGDAAAVGGVAAVGEGFQHHRASERDNTHADNSGNIGTTYSGAGQPIYGAPAGTATATGAQSTSYPQDSASTQGSGHHYGRDAAAVGGAAAVGEGIHHHRENERENLVSKSEYPGTTPSGVGSGTYYGAPSGTAVSGPHDTATANKLDPRVNTGGAPIDDVHQHHEQTGGGAEQADIAHSGKQHHYGRDAAAVGAAGLGAHELDKHHRENQLEKEQRYGSSTGSTNAPINVSSTQQSRDQEHHHERNAAGMGAAGLGANDLNKHKETEAEKQQRLGTTPRPTAATGVSAPTGSSVDTDPILVGPVHRSSLLNKLDPRVKEVSRENAAAVTGGQDHADTAKDHHYGRDVAGVGAAGIGAHELSKHHKEKELEKEQTHGADVGQASGATSTHRHGEADAAAAVPLTGTAGYEAEKRHASQTPYDSTQHGHESTSGSKDHHYGRDAAGIGAVGVGANELSKHHKESELKREQGHGGTGTTGDGLVGVTGLSEHEKLKREVAIQQKGNHYGQELPGSSSAMTGNPTTEKDHHYGRDAAGAGVVGAGAYEAEKHHGHEKDQKALEKEHKHEEKVAEKERKRELKEEKKEEKKSGHGGLLGFLHRDKNKKYSKEEEDEFDRQEREHNSHKGRDVALGAGAAGVGAHELNKQHEEKDLEREVGHGSTPEQTNTSTHPGRDTAGTGAVGYEAVKHHHDHQHTDSDTMKPLPTAPGNDGLGTGDGTGNALVMERKRGEGYGDSVGESPVGSTLGDKLHGPARNRGVDLATGNIAGTNQPADEKYITGAGTHSHLGASAASGGVTAQEHDHIKHDTVSGTDYSTSPTGGNYTTSAGNTGYGSTSQTGSQVPRDPTLDVGTGSSAGGLSHLTSSSGGHKKLHKDPPANHPAAQYSGTGDGSGDRAV